MENFQQKPKDITGVGQSNDVEEKINGLPEDLKVGFRGLLDAVAQNQEDLQPCGVEIFERTKGEGIASVMVTSHHAIGGMGVYGINAYLKDKGLTSGSIFSEAEHLERGNIQNANLFFVNKDNKWISQEGIEEMKKMFPDEDPNKKLRDEVRVEINKLESENNLRNWPGVYGWRSALKRLMQEMKEKFPEKKSFKVLLVEDNNTNRFVATLSFSPEVDAGELTIDTAEDLFTANKSLDTYKYDGVVTDLYFPSKVGTNDKTEGEKIFLKVSSHFTGDEGIGEAALKNKKSELKNN